MTKKITVQEEGVTISDGVRVLNFIGAGATATGDGSVADITIPGGGGGGALPPTDIYVAVGGLDTNTGLSSGSPFLTLTKAINTIGEAAPANYAPIIHIGNGTYAATQLQGVKWPALTRESSGIIFWGDGAGQGGDDGCDVIHTGTFSAALTDDVRFFKHNVLTASAALPGTYVGHTLEITSGTNNGQRRTILEQNGDDLVVAYGFNSNQASGNFRVFLPAVVIDNNSTPDGNIRQHFQMMPLAQTHGPSTDWGSIINRAGGNFGEPIPSSPACVWANVVLTNTSGNTLSEFLFAGGQACLFGVVLGQNAILRTDLNSLFVGTSKSLLSQNNTVVFQPPPTLQPLKNAVASIGTKWNGWGLTTFNTSSGFKCSYIRRMSCQAWFCDNSFELQGLELASLHGCYSPIGLQFYNCNFSMEESFTTGQIYVEGGRCELGSDVYADDLFAASSHVMCLARLSSTGVAVDARYGAKVLMDMGGLTGGGNVRVTGSAPVTAIPIGDLVGAGVAVLTVDTTQSAAYFTASGMGIMGSDGSIVHSLNL